jgi:hypothetical protein
VPQEWVSGSWVGSDEPKTRVYETIHSGELTALKGAWLVREGAVGNAPHGNALAAYFTLFVRIALIGHPVYSWYVRHFIWQAMTSL